ncbi:Proteophosphoglycan ppg4 [Rhodotorula toruloides ATCC 204091]|uniref:Proteophosphoglycan ppg4 n=1 Tax=Rhodotorula toruloides TaxID=5286 RepID=A0A0K3CB09_RHOTO|nr:Proteophosphoglycan ppg4 [Rhodotorula toruloides ATCC 204091]KAK4334781.1 Proteophosphoglycan ppg4 [Rhodotorula toruloides]PRQ76173.1 Proteophosphoglycan ppg4 [Rhodotorula toruloides]
MSSPASTPSHFDRLPTELLKHIVVLVHQQDQNFRKSGIGGARVTNPSKQRKRVYDSDYEDLEPPRPVLTNGKFSAWHGRGLYAVSLLNKRLRELCLPFLCPVATAKQFASIFYRFGLIPQTILDGVQRIDLHTASLSQIVAAALALPQLPLVDTLEVPVLRYFTADAPHIAEHSPTLSDTACLATKAFRDRASRISALIIHNEVIIARLAEYISTFADLNTVRSLEFRNSDSTLFDDSDLDFSRSSSVRLHCLTMLPSLAHLDISGVVADDWEDLLNDTSRWPDDAQFQALQCFRTEAWSSWIFSFVEKCMPCLVKLEVIFPADPVNVEPFVALPSSPTLHHLEALSITGPPCAFAILAQLTLPRVRNIHLTFISFDSAATLDCTTIVPPDTLFARRVALRIATPPTIRLENVEVFAKWCERHDIDLSWTPGSRLAVLNQPLTISADDAGMSNTADAVLDTLAWACDHGKRLRDLGDTAGLRELAELVKPLCERRMIEEM